MPVKGRVNPGEDPFRKGHNKQSQFKDVHNLGPILLAEFQDKLPKIKWKEGSRLCGTCRALAFKKIKNREKYLGTAQSHDRGEYDHLLSPSENTSGSTGNQASPHPSTENPPSTSAYPNLSSEMGKVQLSPASSKPLPSPPRSATGCSSPQLLGDSPFVTPVTPASLIARRTHNVPQTSTPTTSRQAFTFSSPSVAPSFTSNDTGSVYSDEGTAKHEMNSLLHNLGVSVPEESIKKHPRRLTSLMNEGIAAFKRKFFKFAGKELPEPTGVPCTCKLCEIVPAAVKAKLQTATSKREKYLMLTTLPNFITIKDMENDYGVSHYVSRKASKLRSTEGPFSCPGWRSTGNPLDETVRSLVIDFYLSDDNSRVNTAARECIFVRNKKGKRKKRAKRMMMMSLKDAYQEFKRTCPEAKIGIAKFAQLRPKNVRWPGLKGVTASCTCIIHENFKKMLEGLQHASLESIEEEFKTDAAVISFMQLYDDYKEFLKYVICDPPTESCYLGNCEICPNEIQLDKIFSYAEGSDVTYECWIKNEISTRTNSFEVFEESFRQILSKFITHEYIYQQQKEFIKSLKNGPLEGGTSGVLTCDFGENYQFVVRDVVQSFHWNNRQATIHPFVLYVHGTETRSPIYKTFFVISNDMLHDATAFHCFREQVIKKIKEQYPHLKHIDYVSDGAGSQYKNFRNIANLLFHRDDYGLTARWVFSATGHGKSTCDAMSAVVKRVIRLRSTSKSKPIIITTTDFMFEVAKAELETPKLEFIYVTREDVDYYRKKLAARYALLKTIPGTQKWHYLEVLEDKQLLTKRFANSANQQVLDVLQPPIESQIADIPGDNTSDDDMSDTVELMVGDFYAVEFEDSYQIGEITEIDEQREIAKLLMMKKTEDSLYWPLTDKLVDSEFSKILVRVEPPKYDDVTDYYKLQDTDLAAITEELKAFKQ